MNQHVTNRPAPDAATGIMTAFAKHFYNVAVLIKFIVGLKKITL